MTSTEETGPPVTRGGWCQLGSVGAAEIMARSGYDWVCLDAQHGLFAPDAVAAAVTALSGVVDVPVLVRTAGHGADEIGRVLDAGAAGVVVPTVESAGQAGAVVAAAHHPPIGSRSRGTIGGLLGREEPGSPRCHVMVETRAGLDDVVAIARTAGVTGVFVGPFDLSASLGTTVDDLLAATAPGDPLPRVVAACTAAGVVPGAFAGDARRAAALFGLGFRMVATGLDGALLRAAATTDARGSADPGRSAY